MRASATSLLIPLALWGCNGGCDPEPEGPLTEEIDGAVPVRVEVGDSVGAGSSAIVVRLVNDYGVAIPGMDATVDLALDGVDLSQSAVSVDLDAMGFGVFAVDSAVPQTVVATVTGSTHGEAGGVGWVTLTEFDAWDLGMDPAWALPDTPDHMVVSARGVVFSLGGQVWFASADGAQPPMLVADLDSAVIDLELTDFDSDAVADVMVVTRQEVLALRGRADGGLSWGSGFEVPGAEVAGAGLGDMDLDGDPDLIIGFNRDGAGGFQVLENDGAWGWSGGKAQELTTTVWDVGLGRIGTDELPDAVVLYPSSTATGMIARYSPNADGNWYASAIEVGGAQLNHALTQGSTLGRVGDMDGDGNPEVVVMGDPASSTRTLAWYVYSGAGVTEFEQVYDRYKLVLADVTGDGLQDMVVAESEPEQLRVLTGDHDGEAAFLNDGVGVVQVGGPIGVADLIDDDTPDLVTTDASAARVQPAIIDLRWGFPHDDWTTWGTAAPDMTHVVDLAGDGYPEVLVVQDQDGATVFQAFQFYSDGGTVRLRSPNASKAGLDGRGGDVAQAVDLAVCGNDVFLLMQDEGTWLWRIKLANNGNVSNTWTTATDAVAVACGDLDGSAGVVTADAEGGWQSWNLQLAAQTSGDLGQSVVDLAIADGAPVACSDDGCSVLAVDLDGDGDDEVIYGGDSPAVEGLGERIELSGQGRARVGDVDADGVLDVVLADPDAGVLRAWRVVDQELAPPLAWHTTRPTLDGGWVVDGDQDDLPEVFWVNVEGNLLRSRVSAE
jgi:hypothetical protein